jgi:hypothetical protein
MPVTPKDYALDCLARARAVVAAAPSAGVAGNDLLRLALALGVAAVDTLIHWVILKAVVKDSSQTPSALAQLPVKYRDLASLADLARHAQRNDESWRPWVVVKNVVQETLLRRTFQSKQEVADGLAMAGIQGGWSKVCLQLGATSQDAESRLSSIVRRRNQIVHEGDYRRLARPRAVETNPIIAAEVNSDLDWLAKFVIAISSVAGY